MQLAVAKRRTKVVWRRLTRLLGLNGWKTKVVVVEDEDEGREGVQARIAVELEYRLANLRVFSDQLSDDADLVETLAHEAIHVALAPLESFDKVLAQGLAGNPDLARALKEALTHAIEQSVTGLEPMVVAAYREVWGDE